MIDVSVKVVFKKLVGALSTLMIPIFSQPDSRPVLHRRPNLISLRVHDIGMTIIIALTETLGTKNFT